MNNQELEYKKLLIKEKTDRILEEIFGSEEIEFANIEIIRKRAESKIRMLIIMSLK